MRTAVLFLMPKSAATATPTIDKLVCQVAWATQNYKLLGSYDKQVDAQVALDENPTFYPNCVSKGWHSCNCGRAFSTNADYVLPGDEVVTNSLAAHYLAYHRHEVPKEVIDFLTAQAERHGWQTPGLTADDRILVGQVAPK